MPVTRAESEVTAPIRATSVKRAYGPGPVTTCCRRAGADYSSGSFLAAARVFSPRGQESGWSARSRAAARTNELDAGWRRKIIEGEEGGWLRLDCRGSRVGPGVWRAGGALQHPTRATPAGWRPPL